MSTRSDTIQAIGQEGVANTDVNYEEQASEVKKKGIFYRAKHLIGKVVTVDEDWIFKSKDWPYLWDHKDSDDKV